jgi:hypothetical protein
VGWKSCVAIATSGIAELIAGVKAGTYKSKAKDLRPIVSLALLKNKRFKRVERGVYNLK